MPQTIRPMTRDDLPAVADIITKTDLFPAEMLPDMAAPFLNGDAQDFWLVTDIAGIATGVAYCAPEQMTEGTWNLLALAVHPDQQGTGQGYALIDQTRTILRAQGARLLLIDTADIPEFADQRAFYTRVGLSQVAHIPDYYAQDTGKVTFAQAL